MKGLIKTRRSCSWHYCVHQFRLINRATALVNYPLSYTTHVYTTVSSILTWRFTARAVTCWNRMPRHYMRRQTKAKTKEAKINSCSTPIFEIPSYQEIKQLFFPSSYIHDKLHYVAVFEIDRLINSNAARAWFTCSVGTPYWTPVTVPGRAWTVSPWSMAWKYELYEQEQAGRCDIQPSYLGHVDESSSVYRSTLKREQIAVSALSNPPLNLTSFKRTTMWKYYLIFRSSRHPRRVSRHWRRLQRASTFDF